MSPRNQKEDAGKVYHAVIANKVFISQTNSAAVPAKGFRYFSTENKLKYFPFCDDFGPMNMASVIRFIELLETEISSYPSHTIVYKVEPGRRALSNAVFLLGSYMILKMDMNVAQVASTFDWLNQDLSEPFRDATYTAVDFELTLLDCWRGLEKGKSLGWIRLPGKTSGGLWGKINVAEYEHYDDPDQGDLHEVVPGKFIAFKGPRDLGTKTYFDDKKGSRHFSPTHYVPIFASHNVSCVIRLNEAQYDGRSFTSQGINHHHLEFPDCTSPTTPVVEQFFRIVDSSSGAVAVHCKAGLGRTGTLIALYLMRTHSFAAREAMAWLRIMRPGSVIGDQQHYLCEVERTVREMLQLQQQQQLPPPAPSGTPPANSKDAPPSAGGGGLRPAKPLRRALVSCAALAAQVANGMDRRGALRAGRSAVLLPAIAGSK